MNLFCAITDTETIQVVIEYTKVDDTAQVLINGVDQSYRTDIPILDSIEITTTNAWLTRVQIDGIDVTQFLPVPQSPSEIVKIPGPFYRWWHQQSGKGWLIDPILPESTQLAK